MPPVVDRARRQLVATFNKPRMFAQDIALGCNDQPVGIDPQADGPVRKGRRDAVAIAFEADQAGGRDPFALLDEAVKRDRQCHQCGPFFGPDIGDRAGQRAMCSVAPQVLATLFQPGIQRGKVGKGRHSLQQLVARIPNVLLDSVPSPTLRLDCRTQARRHSGSSSRGSGC